MKNKGFTLIEILVAVLIIGILAAIAVPKYKKAVIKSKYGTLKSVTKSLYEAEKVYYLQNGHWTTKFEDLDLSLIRKMMDNAFGLGPKGGNAGTCRFASTYVYCEKYDDIGMAYLIKFADGKPYCVDGAGEETGITAQICKEETGNESVNGYWYPYN